MSPEPALSILFVQPTIEDYLGFDLFKAEELLSAETATNYDRQR